MRDIVFALGKPLGRQRRTHRVGVVEKLWSPKGSVAEGRILALGGEAGYQSDLLRGGFHFGLWRWQYRIHKVALVTVPQGKIGYVYARDGQSVGVGAGQMSRVDSCKIGAMKAILPLQGTVAASDAFFPFPDGVEEIARAGATAIIQPGGSMRDAEVIATADRLGLAMVLTGVRHFRH